MASTKTYSVKSRDIVAEDFEGEFVVLDLGSGKYFSLAGGAAVIWRALTAGHSIESLCAQLPSDDPRRAQAEAAATSLVDHALLVAGDAGPNGAPEIAAEFAATSGPYAIEVFDDLSDLLVADPIHDVDPEAGWPHLPNKD